ncbi:hypothetical protein BRAS3843_670082 [Bradyrhizobium sp. STM 3843]|uniref:hypothetical protein n=1 Tax=Bradyrhizobium sp. STM 3843 TaxID=551947 RepID=UPI00024035D4|nr:hypothetical protein [Bradyrhizobium sp. STM 3843]CCE11379.1 hypothetical protein BRAS3843_670082 [Bradyrhizobium sp. STM 3843]
MTDLDQNKELNSRRQRRGIGATMLIAVIAAIVIVAALFWLAPRRNQTASDSANSNTPTIGQGAGGPTGPAPTMPRQAAPNDSRKR